MTMEINTKPWQTFILKAEGSRVFIGGGKSQGIKPGMTFSVLTAGETIKSPQTGANITLPGQAIATIRVDSLFGESELNEGAVASVVSGSIGNKQIRDMVIRFDGAQ